MDLSVVMPAYNAEHVLSEQLEALIDQWPGGRWEVVVADNGSTDRTKEVAESFRDRLPIRVIDASRRRGRAAACNAGAAKAVADHLLFLDADDVVEAGYVAAMQSALADCRFVASRLDCESLNPGWISEVRQPAQRTGLGRGAFPYGYGATLGVHRSAFEKVGGFDETFGTAEDIDFCYRMAIEGFELVFVPQAVVRYRYRTTLRSIWRQAYAYGLGAAEIRRRYGPYGEPAEGLFGAARLGFGLARSMLANPGKGSTARALYILANRLGRTRGRLRPPMTRKSEPEADG